jgi:excisionase family DNA binding protein
MNDPLESIPLDRPHVLTPQQAARVLSVSKQSIQKLFADGRLRGFKRCTGGDVRLLAVDVFRLCGYSQQEALALLAGNGETLASEPKRRRRKPRKVAPEPVGDGEPAPEPPKRKRGRPRKIKPAPEPLDDDDQLDDGDFGPGCYGDDLERELDEQTKHEAPSERRPRYLASELGAE